MPHAPHVPALLLRSVSKTYPGVQAARDVTLSILPGEVHALVGQNGAGKSTLIKIATGAVAPNEGTIEVGGQVVERPTRRALTDLGVRVVYQERHTVPDLTVAENVLLDALPSQFGMVQRKAMVAEARARLARLGIDIAPDVRARRLGVAQLQLVEIARAAVADAKVLILDEPTASLHRHETDRLFEVVSQLRDSGVGILFISHHLDEVFEIADRVSVLRDGALVAAAPVTELDAASLSRHMFGRDVAEVERSAADSTTDADRTPALSIRGLEVGHRLRGVDLDVFHGEVVAVTGAMGSGTGELAAAAVGALRPDGGEVHLAGHGRVAGRRSVARRVGYLPSDRKRSGLMLERSVADNLLLGPLATGAPVVIRRGWLRRWARTVADRAGVRGAGVDVPVQSLSGGNQQKVVLGRWLDVGVDVLVLDEPTVGVDVEAARELYRRVHELAAEGAAVLVCTTDFREVRQIADRCIVLRHGQVIAELDAREADEHRLVEIEFDDTSIEADRSAA